jgi:hypothetical protein
MKRLTMVAILLWGSGICLAQDSKQEIQGVYLRIQGFTFNSGSTDFNIQNASINGGGYAFVYHITEKFGLFQQMGFFGGAEQNGLKVKLITEFQGMQVNKKTGPLLLYAKGGLGFTRYVFSGAFSGVDSHFALNYGGGTEIKIKEGLNLILEATRLTMGLPNLTNAPGRSGWDNSWQLATGIAIHF